MEITSLWTKMYLLGEKKKKGEVITYFGKMTVMSADA